MTLKVFAICFHRPTFGKIETELLLIPAKESPHIGAVRSSISGNRILSKNFSGKRALLRITN